MVRMKSRKSYYFDKYCIGFLANFNLLIFKTDEKYDYIYLSFKRMYYHTLEEKISLGSAILLFHSFIEDNILKSMCRLLIEDDYAPIEPLIDYLDENNMINKNNLEKLVK